MRFEPELVRQNAAKASTEDLLDRVTVYRAGMEPAALPILEAELARRGVKGKDIAAHAEERSWETVPLPDGTVARCNFCHRPAVIRRWAWYRLFRVLPVFPMYHCYCTEHRPGPRPRHRGDDPEPPGPGPGPRAQDDSGPGDERIHIRLGD